MARGFSDAESVSVQPKSDASLSALEFLIGKSLSSHTLSFQIGDQEGDTKITDGNALNHSKPKVFDWRSVLPALFLSISREVQLLAEVA